MIYEITYCQIRDVAHDLCTSSSQLNNKCSYPSDSPRPSKKFTKKLDTAYCSGETTSKCAIRKHLATASSDLKPRCYLGTYLGFVSVSYNKKKTKKKKKKVEHNLGNRYLAICPGALANAGSRVHSLGTTAEAKIKIDAKTLSRNRLLQFPSANRVNLSSRRSEPIFLPLNLLCLFKPSPVLTFTPSPQTD